MLRVVSAAFSSVTTSTTSAHARSRRALRSISTCSLRCTVPYGFAPWATHSSSVLMSSEWQLVIVDGVSSASNWRQVGGACLPRLGFVGGLAPRSQHAVQFVRPDVISDPGRAVAALKLVDLQAAAHEHALALAELLGELRAPARAADAEPLRRLLPFLATRQALALVDRHTDRGDHLAL